MPGFVDTHIHAPQFSFVGLGQGLPLLDWLNTYTFPFEAKFKNLDMAHLVYPKAVQRLLRNGTTTVSWFATIHLESSLFLAETAAKLGQRAFVGKVNMDVNCPSFYREDSERSSKDTEEFVSRVLTQHSNNGLVKPIITPRFAPTCTSSLMHSLGALAAKHSLPIQSHVSENESEIAWVKELFPSAASYTDVYAQHGLLTSRTLLAHGVHLTDQEARQMAAAGAGISHCPLSNVNLCSGFMPLRHLLSLGVKVGLGTDVCGGYAPSMLHAMRDAITCSTVISIQDKAKSNGHSPKPLSFGEAFHLATLAGAELLGIENQVGNFLAGKEFDAIRIDPNVVGGPFDLYGYESKKELIEKFVFLGDDRNVAEVFIQGKSIAI